MRSIGVWDPDFGMSSSSPTRCVIHFFFEKNSYLPKLFQSPIYTDVTDYWPSRVSLKYKIAKHSRKSYFETESNRVSAYLWISWKIRIRTTEFTTVKPQATDFEHFSQSWKLLNEKAIERNTVIVMWDLKIQ